MGATQLFGSVVSASDKLQMQWESAPVGSFQMSSDRLYILLFDKDNKLIASSSAIEQRDSGSLEIVDINAVKDDNYTIVSCFAREDGTIVGDASVLKVTAI